MKFYGGKNAFGKNRRFTAVIALVLLLCFTIGGTVAYLVTKTDEVENVFTPATVKVETHEDFDGTIKKDLYVENKGDTDVYIRVKLVTYMQDADGKPTGVTATIPSFTKGTNWFYVDSDDCYYYSKPVPAGSKTNDLFPSNGIELVDGQVVDVLVEGIQATPTAAVSDAWGVTVTGTTISK